MAPDEPVPDDPVPDEDPPPETVPPETVPVTGAGHWMVAVPTVCPDESRAVSVPNTTDPVLVEGAEYHCAGAARADHPLTGIIESVAPPVKSIVTLATSCPVLTTTTAMGSPSAWPSTSACCESNEPLEDSTRPPDAMPTMFDVETSTCNVVPTVPQADESFDIAGSITGMEIMKPLMSTPFAWRLNTRRYGVDPG